LAQFWWYCWVRVRADGAGALGSLGDAVPGREVLAGALPATCRGRAAVAGVAVAAPIRLVILLAGHHAIAEDGWGCSGVHVQLVG
jgi:hypothetical protein